MPGVQGGSRTGSPGPALRGAATPKGSRGRLTKGYEAVHDLRQVLAGLLLLGGVLEHT